MIVKAIRMAMVLLFLRWSGEDNEFVYKLELIYSTKDLEDDDMSSAGFLDL